MANKKSPFDRMYEEVKATSPLRVERSNSDYLPADFTKGMLPTKAKVIKKKDSGTRKG